MKIKQWDHEATYGLIGKQWPTLIVKAVDSQSYLQRHTKEHHCMFYTMWKFWENISLSNSSCTWICLYTASWGGWKVAVLVRPHWTQTWSTQTFSALNKCRRHYQTYGANTSKLQDRALDIISKLFRKRKCHYNIKLHIVNPETGEFYAVTVWCTQILCLLLLQVQNKDFGLVRHWTRL